MEPLARKQKKDEQINSYNWWKEIDIDQIHFRLILKCQICTCIRIEEK